MKLRRSLLPLSLTPLVLAAAACSQSHSQQLVDGSADRAYPARLALTGLSTPADAAPLQAEGGQWQAKGEQVLFGVPGQPAMLSIACEHAPDGAATVNIMRITRAEEGAKALFALIGNGRIARLPLDAVRAGEPGQWHGLIPAADGRLDVLKGGNRLEATLPGGGTLKLPASSEPGRLLAACRASDRASEAHAA